MNLQQLNTFLINEGTESNPFILTDREVDTLYRISVQADTEKHKIEGWVNTESKSMPSYIKHNLEKKFPNLHILATGASSQAWTVDFVSHSINEGSATKIIVTNLTADSLEYTVTVESLQVTSGIYNETQVLQHFHVDTEKAEVSYDKPTSDAGWVASLAVKFKPTYITDPEPEDYRTVRINVVAVAVTSIEILADDYVGLNGQTDIRVRTLPINNTKDSEDHKIALSVTGGGYVAPNQLSGLTGSAVYYAPTSGNEVTIGADLHMFGASAIYAAASKVIAMRAIIQARIVERNGANPVDLRSAYITLTAPDGTETKLKNGESMLVVADGSTTYSVDCVETDNYSGTVDKTSITPTDALTVVTATYMEKIYGATFIFDDDAVENADDYFDEKNNLLTDASTQGRIRNHLVAVGLRNSNCAFMIPFDFLPDYDYNEPYVVIPEGLSIGDTDTPQVPNFDINAARNRFDGYQNTIQQAAHYTKIGITESLPQKAVSKKKIILGVERTGYIPSVGEGEAMLNPFYDKYIRKPAIIKGKSLIGGYGWVWASTETSATGQGVIGIVGYGVNSVLRNGSNRGFIICKY